MSTEPMSVRSFLFHGRAARSAPAKRYRRRAREPSLEVREQHDGRRRARRAIRDFIAGLADFQAEAHPRTRTQLLTRWLMFGTLARRSRFKDR